MPTAWRSWICTQPLRAHEQPAEQAPTEVLPMSTGRSTNGYPAYRGISATQPEPGNRQSDPEEVIEETAVAAAAMPNGLSTLDTADAPTRWKIQHHQYPKTPTWRWLKHPPSVLAPVCVSLEEAEENRSHWSAFSFPPLHESA